MKLSQGLQLKKEAVDGPMRTILDRVLVRELGIDRDVAEEMLEGLDYDDDGVSSTTISGKAKLGELSTVFEEVEIEFMIRDAGNDKYIITADTSIYLAGSSGRSTTMKTITWEVKSGRLGKPTTR